MSVRKSALRAGNRRLEELFGKIDYGTWAEKVDKWLKKKKNTTLDKIKRAGFLDNDSLHSLYMSGYKPHVAGGIILGMVHEEKWSGIMKSLVESLGAFVEGKQIPKISKWVDEWKTDDYPYGRFRTEAKWTVEKKGNQMRIARVTVNPKTGRQNKPKLTKYGDVAKIGVSGDRAYMVIGGPGQIGVYDGAFNYIGSVFGDNPDYKMLAKGLGIEKAKGGGKSVQVKKVENGATIDGLQGTETTIREILKIGGMSDDQIGALDKVKRGYKPGKGSVWTAQFKDKRPDYVITVRD